MHILFEITLESVVETTSQIGFTVFPTIDLVSQTLVSLFLSQEMHKLLLSK